MTEHKTAHREIQQVVYTGAEHLVAMYSAQKDSIVREQMADSLETRFDRGGVLTAVDEWVESFTAKGDDSHKWTLAL